MATLATEVVAAGEATRAPRRQYSQGVKNLAGLVRSYFDLDGMKVHFNVVPKETLRDAQKHPEKYQDLLVRVAGYSAYFTELDPSLQDDIISRTEHKFRS